MVTAKSTRIRINKLIVCILARSNPREAHRSGWTVGYFKKRGYKVFGIGFRFHRYFGKYGYFLNLLFTILTSRLIPNIANELIATKDLKK